MSVCRDVFRIRSASQKISRVLNSPMVWKGKVRTSFFSTAIWLTHSQLWATHYRGMSLTHPMLIIASLQFQPEGHHPGRALSGGLNRKPSDSNYNALRHSTTLPFCLEFFINSISGQSQKSIQNQVKHLRWSVLQKQSTPKSCQCPKYDFIFCRKLLIQLISR